MQLKFWDCSIFSWLLSLHNTAATPKSTNTFLAAIQFSSYIHQYQYMYTFCVRTYMLRKFFNFCEEKFWNRSQTMKILCHENLERYGTIVHWISQFSRTFLLIAICVEIYRGYGNFQISKNCRCYLSQPTEIITTNKVLKIRSES